MAEALKVGEVVWLNSGGPAMTVTQITYKDEVWVSWIHEATATHSWHAFPQVCLTRVNPCATPPPEAREPQGA